MPLNIWVDKNGTAFCVTFLFIHLVAIIMLSEMHFESATLRGEGGGVKGKKGGKEIPASMIHKSEERKRRRKQTRCFQVPD